MTKVYLAGSLSRIAKLKYIKEDLNKLPNMLVTSTWMDNPFAPNRLKLNLQELEQSDILAVDLNAISTTGGYHVEIGYAMAKDKLILGVGPIRNGYSSLFKSVDYYNDLYNML